MYLGVMREDLVKPSAKGRIERKIKGPFQEGKMEEGTPLIEGWSTLYDYEGYERWERWERRGAMQGRTPQQRVVS
jgi:hypothetical protein